MSRLARSFWLLPLLVALGISTAVLLAEQRAPLVVPADAEWELLARAIEPQMRPNDAFVVEPGWLVNGLVRFERRLRSKTSSSFEPTLNINGSFELNPSNLAEMQRLWVIRVDALAGSRQLATPHGFERTELPIALPAIVSRAFDVRLYRRARVTTLYDIVENLRDAVVTRADGRGRVTRCRAMGDKIVCPKPNKGDYWYDLVERRADLSDSGQRVIYAHIAQPNGKLSLDYPAIPLGRALVGHIGWWMHAHNVTQGEPIEFEIRIGDQLRYHRWLQPNDNRWLRFEVDTSLQRGELRPVTFHLRGRDQNWRISYFEARSID